MLVDGQNFLMFFIFEGEVYGCTETHRVTFARMKDPGEEDTEAWLEEACFVAYNLYKAMQGKSAHEMFYYDDISDIKVISKEKAYELLKNLAEQINVENLKINNKSFLKILKK